MKITIPKYIKFILMYCGYNNCHTISTIDQADLNYIVAEVRQGNVTNFYDGLGISDAMEGSIESARNFEFIRGHERLLMAIVNFVKQQLCDHGADIFLVDTPKSYNEDLIQVKLSKDRRTVTILEHDERHDVISNSDVEASHNVCRVHEDIIKHQHTLLTMAVKSLSMHTPQMYEDNVATVAHRISKNLVEVVTLNPCDQPQYTAILTCPYCFDFIYVIHNATWKITTFDQHLQNNHKGEESKDERRQSENAKDIIPGFVGLNLNQNSLKHLENGGQMSKVTFDTISMDNQNHSFNPSLADYNIVMADFKQIWFFVERELKISIPTYIKYILKYCGYENCHTISTIDENDLEFIEKEVQDKFANDFDLTDVTTELSGNFRLSRGHQKLMMTIAKLVKEKLNECGVDGFSVTEPRKRAIGNACSIPAKTLTLSSSFCSSQGCIPGAVGSVYNMKEHKSIVLRKMILSLISNTPEMFANVSILTDGSLLVQNRQLPRQLIHDKEEEKISENLGVILQTFVESAERNFDRSKQGYPLAYETLNANLPLSIPSVSTARRFLKDKGPIVIEGKMRTEELLQYLKSRNLPLKVSISEDATRITAKISYDPVTNQLVGFALPLDENGMPITFSFPARNTSEIQKHFLSPSNVVSSSVYVQMAQPLDPNAAPFCLLLYLTDNTFTAANTLTRWKFQADILREKAIAIENISTDGDSRPLKVMKYLSKIGQTNKLYIDCEWFSCGGSVETTFTQDQQYEFEGLTKAAIIVEIEKARKAVINDLENLGIDSSNLNFHCQVKPIFENDVMEDVGDTDSCLYSDSEDSDWSSGGIDEETINHENDNSDLYIENMEEDLDSLYGT
ncbi:hypothetical protein Bhyg_07588, partial [Pseudolycoriella hygida]